MANKKVEAAFHEVYENVPKNVKKTGKTGEAKRKMMTAIALSKARAAGANIPKKHEGGVVANDGIYELQKGERVIPAGDKKSSSTNPSGNPAGPGRNQAVNTGASKMEKFYDSGAKGPKTTSNKPAYEETSKVDGGNTKKVDQPQNYGTKYPGREYPPVQAVTQAECKPGEALKCARVQTDSNRHELNAHVAAHGGKY